MKTTFAVATFVASVLAQAPSIPDLIASQPDLSILGTALGLVPELAEVLGSLSNITILAPTDSAFQALLSGNTSQEAFSISQQDAAAVAKILSYHVLNGTFISSDFSETPAFAHSLLAPSADEPFATNVTGGQNVGLVLDGETATILSGELETANVVQADIEAANSVTVHKIDSVLKLPSRLSTTLTDLTEAEVSAAVAALVAVDLVDTVESLADITVFVPNDAAFAAVASTIANATNETITSILTYHVVAGAVVFSSDITNTSVPTVNGNDVTLSVGTDGTVYVDNAKVVLPNIILANGVAHIIDAVLDPNSDVETPTPSASPSANGTAPTGYPTGSPLPSEFPGAATSLKGAFGGIAAGLIMALFL